MLSTSRVTTCQSRQINCSHVAKDESRKTIDAAPLFRRLGDQSGAVAKFARQYGISQQRITNWRKRGLPAAELPAICAALGVSVEQYLKEAGQVPHVLRQQTAEYLLDDERELLQAYRSSTGRWKVVIMNMARLRGNANQDEAADTMNYVLTKIFAMPVTDARVEETYGFPPGIRPKEPKR